MNKSEDQTSKVFLPAEIKVRINITENTLELYPNGTYVIRNEYGTSVTLFKCESCGSLFTVCPAKKEEDLNDYRGCLSTECESYDESRDIDKLWDAYNFFGVIKKRDISDNV